MKARKVFNDYVHKITIDHNVKRNVTFPYNINITHHEDGLKYVLVMSDKELGDFISELMHYQMDVE